MNPLRDLDATRRRLGMSLLEVWLGYVGIGGNGSRIDVASWLAGTAAVTPVDFDLLAQAVNDQAVVRGLDHPVRYFDGS